MGEVNEAFDVVCRLHNAGGSPLEFHLPDPNYSSCVTLTLNPDEMREYTWRLSPELPSESDIDENLLAASVTAAYDRLCASGYDLLDPAGRRNGQAALLLAVETQALLRTQGLATELTGGLLLLDRPQPHAWLRLPDGGALDPWLYLVLRRHPDFLLPLDLAPEPEVYLGGHEGRRIGWPDCPEGSFTQPLSQPDGALVYDLAYPRRPLLHPDNLLAAVRTLAFSLLFLTALGLMAPGGGALAAYLAYVIFLLARQGRGFMQLWNWRSIWGRRFSLEAILLHAAALTVLFAADTVLPQTAYILLWMSNRIGLALSFPCKKARR